MKKLVVALGLFAMSFSLYSMDSNKLLEELFTAIANDEIQEVKNILQQDQSLINAQTQARTMVGPQGTTVLMFAIARGKVRITSVLIQQPNLQLDLAEESGVTALMLASSVGSVRIVRELVAKKVNLNKQLKNGDTALMLAIKKKNEDISKILLEAGADIEAANKSGITPLMLAASFGLAEVVQELLIRKADPNKQATTGDFAGSTALIFAILNNDINIVGVLLNMPGINVNLALASGITPLMLASFLGSDEIVRKLVAKDADVNKQTVEAYEIIPKGSTAIMIAVEGEQKEIVKTILTVPAIDLKLANAEGKTALEIAQKTKNNEILKLLSSIPRETVTDDIGLEKSIRNLTQSLNRLRGTLG